MSIFGSSKKKKEETLKTEAVKEKAEALERKQGETQSPIKKFAFSSGVIIKPHISEKAHDLVNLRQYIFDVAKKSNKVRIMKAVEDIYHVKVEKVRTINIPSKKRRLGRTVGKKSGYKKAIVTLKEGYAIEIMPH